MWKWEQRRWGKRKEKEKLKKGGKKSEFLTPWSWIGLWIFCSQFSMIKAAEEIAFFRSRGIVFLYHPNMYSIAFPTIPLSLLGVFTPGTTLNKQIVELFSVQWISFILIWILIRFVKYYNFFHFFFC